jgi:putative PEP-CTERM system TPR-repeat lipoprotein
LMANALLLDDHADIAMLLYAKIPYLQSDWRIMPLPLEAGQLPETAVDNTANFPQTDILLILTHLGKGGFPGAIEAAKSYQSRDLMGLAPYRVLARVYFTAGQPTEAKDVLDKALKREPGDPSANLLLAEMALVAGDPDSARRYYQIVLDHHPDDLATLMQLVALESREKNETAMVARLNQAIQAHPGALEPRLRLATYHYSSGRPDKVEPLLAKLTGLQRLSPRVLELTALAQLAQNQNDSALATLQQLVDATPESAEAWYLLAVATTATGDKPKTKQALRKAIKRDPKHILSLVRLAGIAFSEGEKGQFERYLATLVELAPNVPQVLRLQALSARASGNDIEALELSQRAFEAAPTIQTVLELAARQKAVGRDEAARNTLLQWIKKHPGDVDVGLVLANNLALENDSAGAQAQYLAVLKQKPSNIIALNNLAWMLRLEDPQKALEYSRKASNLAPDQPALLDTLAVIQSLTGDHKSARSNMQRALAANPDDKTMRYHEAMIAAARGDTAPAIATLEALVTNDASDFPERAEAEALLQQLQE